MYIFLKVSKAVLSVNEALGENSEKLYTSLSASELEYDSLKEECADQYMEKLTAAKSTQSESGRCRCA